MNDVSVFTYDGNAAISSSSSAPPTPGGSSRQDILHVNTDLLQVKRNLLDGIRDLKNK